MCRGNPYHKKLEDKLLIAIYSKYIEAHGEQQSALNTFKFNSLDESLYEGMSEAVSTPIDVLANVDARYIKNLEDKGYISKESNSTPWTFSLSHDGFLEAQKLISPYKHFFIMHWKFIIGVLLTFISSMTAIMKYIQCI